MRVKKLEFSLTSSRKPSTAPSYRSQTPIVHNKALAWSGTSTNEGNLTNSDPRVVRRMKMVIA